MKISNAAVLLISGFTIGAITGLLLAPQEGIKSRKKLMKRAKKYKETLEGKAHEYKNKAEDIKDNIAGAANDIKRRFS